MDITKMQLVAGSISSIIFAMGTLNMLVKAWRTKDVSSYSVMQIILNSIGNLIYWAYVLSLPFGPVYVLHGFYTVSTFLMLMWCIAYRTAPKTATATLKRLTQPLTTRAIDIRETVETLAIKLG